MYNIIVWWKSSPPFKNEIIIIFLFGFNCLSTGTYPIENFTVIDKPLASKDCEKKKREDLTSLGSDDSGDYYRIKIVIKRIVIVMCH